MTKANPFICIGAAHWDIVARTAHPAPPGADIPGIIRRQPGGVALNVARALARLGQDVTLLSAIGNDSQGDDLIRQLQADGINCRQITRLPAATDCYLAVEVNGEIHVAIADCTLLETAGPSILRPLDLAANVIADGNLGEAILARLNSPNLFCVPASPAKARRLRPSLARGGVTFYANLFEAGALCDRHLANAAQAAGALVRLGAARAIITDGPGEVASYDGTRLCTASPPPHAPHSATGAGDAFLAAHLVATLTGADPQSALDSAMKAAAGHIGKPAP